VWTASLRFILYMPLFLTLWLVTKKNGMELLKSTGQAFAAHWKFWCIAGGIGYGLFYAPFIIVFYYVSGWVVASTWQMVIPASIPVILLLGGKVPFKAVVFSLLVCVGAVLVNVGEARNVSGNLLMVFLCGIISVFAFPIGAQMLNVACNEGRGIIPRISEPNVRESAPAQVLLMTLGSLPFWFVLIFVFTLVRGLPAPTGSQWLYTGVLALTSGVVATAVFYYALNSTRNGVEAAVLYATGGGEVIFALIGEIIFLSGAAPTFIEWGGIVLIFVGLALYAFSKKEARNKGTS